MGVFLGDMIGIAHKKKECIKLFSNIDVQIPLWMGSGLPKSHGTTLSPSENLKISPENQRFDLKVEV